MINVLSLLVILSVVAGMIYIYIEKAGD